MPDTMIEWVQGRAEEWKRRQPSYDLIGRLYVSVTLEDYPTPVSIFSERRRVNLGQ